MVDVIVFPLDAEPHTSQLPSYEDGSPEIKALYDLIGCDMVQCVYLNEGVLWLDEEGKLKNPCIANKHANRHFQRQLFDGDYLAGVVVLVPNDVGLFNVLAS